MGKCNDIQLELVDINYRIKTLEEECRGPSKHRLFILVNEIRKLLDQAIGESKKMEECQFVDPRIGKLTTQDAAMLDKLAQEMGGGDCMPVWMRKEIDSKTKTIVGFPTISDGFGSEWSVICPVCKKDSMYVVRPGKVQCGNCG